MVRTKAAAASQRAANRSFPTASSSAGPPGWRMSRVSPRRLPHAAAQGSCRLSRRRSAIDDLGTRRRSHLPNAAAALPRTLETPDWVSSINRGTAGFAAGVRCDRGLGKPSTGCGNRPSPTDASIRAPRPWPPVQSPSAPTEPRTGHPPQAIALGRSAREQPPRRVVPAHGPHRPPPGGRWGDRCATSRVPRRSAGELQPADGPPRL